MSTADDDHDATATTTQSKLFLFVITCGLLNMLVLLVLWVDRQHQLTTDDERKTSFFMHLTALLSQHHMQMQYSISQFLSAQFASTGGAHQYFPRAVLTNGRVDLSSLAETIARTDLLEADHDDETDASLPVCGVCHARRSDWVLLSCRHMVCRRCCSMCHGRTTCVFCNEAVVAGMRVFFP